MIPLSETPNPFPLDHPYFDMSRSAKGRLSVLEGGRKKQTKKKRLSPSQRASSGRGYNRGSRVEAYSVGSVFGACAGWNVGKGVCELDGGAEEEGSGGPEENAPPSFDNLAAISLALAAAASTADGGSSPEGAVVEGSIGGGGGRNGGIGV